MIKEFKLWLVQKVKDLFGWLSRFVFTLAIFSVPLLLVFETPPHFWRDMIGIHSLQDEASLVFFGSLLVFGLSDWISRDPK